MDKSIEKLQSILEKNKNPIDSLKLEVELFGVFSIPESWKPVEIESIEFTHNVTISKVQFLNGKTRRRELTEEEHRQLEESKKQKKDLGKKKGQENELTAEELQQAEKRKKSHEEQKRKRDEEWERASDESKFYLAMEDIYKHPCITWESDSSQEDFRLVKSYSQIIDKKPMEILEFEECVEDSGGFFLEFTRVPKVVEEDPKKKIKMKAQEDQKPCSARAWVDLRGLQEAGRDEVHVRARLEESEGESGFKDTYIYLRVKVTPPITPFVTHIQAPVVSVFTNTEKIPDPTYSFRKQIKLSTLKIAQDYQAMFAEQQGDNQRKLPVSKQKEHRGGRKDKFLYDFNLSGKAQGLKEKLKKAIVDVLKDHLAKKMNISGLEHTDKDKLLSEVYAYLVEQMNASVDEVVKENKESLHEDIVIPWDLAVREKELSHINAPKESIDEKLLRLANEYEIQGKIQKSNDFHKERACRDPKNISIWMDFTRFCLRNGDISHGEEYIKEILRLNENSFEHLLLLGSLLLQRQRYEEASIYLHAAADKDFYNVPANLVLSLLYKFANKPGLEKRFSSIAKRLCMRHLGLLPQKRGSKSNFNSSLENCYFRLETAPGEYTRALTLDQVDDMYYFLTDYFLKEKLIYLASKTLEEVSNKGTSLTRYLFYQAQISYWRKDYAECATILADLLKTEPKHESAWVLLGNTLYLMNNHFDAEEAYLKAVRSAGRSKTMLSGRSNSHISDYSILLRLGHIYMRRRAWNDAKLVYSRCCEESPTSTSWTMLGLSCLHLNEVNEAEEALTEGNIMDEQNPVNWGALAYLCAKKTEKMPGRIAQFNTCVGLAIGYGLMDSYLLVNICKEYVRILVTGDENNHAMVVRCVSLATKAVIAEGKQVDDLVAIITETFAQLRAKFSYKARKIDDLQEKVLGEIKSVRYL